MLQISYPLSFQNERKWIVSVLLREFLGLDFLTEVTNESCFRIFAEGKKLLIADTFFAGAESNWLTEESMPNCPLKQLDTAGLDLEINLVEAKVPIIFGDNTIDIGSEHIRMGLDIFGSAFFMLSRYEEVVKDERDQFDRFPAAASLAYKEGFLNRPIINEYLEILWAVMKRLWPGLKRKKREARTLISCDLDVPYSWGTKNLIYLARQIGGDLIYRRNLIQSIRSGLNYFFAKSGNYVFDIYYNTIKQMMDLNEKAGNRVVFHFIALNEIRRDSIIINGCYSLDETVILDLMRSISDRGHEIGLHLSYNTFQDYEETCNEAQKLRQIMQKIGISQDILGSRQHFLRWLTPTTPRNLDAAAIDYDTTLTFAEQAGFRCGVCYEYSFYDVVERRKLSLRERPLVVMEKSVFDKDYMGCSYGVDSLCVFEQLKQICHQFDGDFTMLWHNNKFPNRQAMVIYKYLIQ